MRSFFFTVAGMIGAMVFSSSAHAADAGAPLTECEKHYALFEQEYNLPPGILRAVATHESGKYLSSAKRKAAWPWTINVAGKGYYFSSRRDALNAIDMHMNTRGIRSVDIGCMQINMIYHGKAFDHNPVKAIVPEDNVRYGAKFLRSRYNVSDSWEDAIGAYHNMIPSIGGRYSAKILKMWKKQQPDFSYGYLARHERHNNGFTALVHRMAPRAVSEVTGVALTELSKFYDTE